MAECIGADAPGRVNLIGEHTDYNGGFVLPTAIPQKTRVELRTRADDRVVLDSVQVPGPVEYQLGAEQPRRDWTDYVQGVTRFLAEAGHRLSGFEARVDSTVPIGSGLS